MFLNYYTSSLFYKLDNQQKEKLARRGFFANSPFRYLNHIAEHSLDESNDIKYLEQTNVYMGIG